MANPIVHWEDAEKKALILALREHAHLIQTKMNPKHVVKAWIKIQNTLRTSGYNHELNQIKEQWDFMKRKAQKNLGSFRWEFVKTSYEIETLENPSEIDYMIAEMIPSVIYEDSDSDTEVEENSLKTTQQLFHHKKIIALTERQKRLAALQLKKLKHTKNKHQINLEKRQNLLEQRKLSLEEEKLLLKNEKIVLERETKTLEHEQLLYRKKLEIFK